MMKPKKNNNYYLQTKKHDYYLQTKYKLFT